MPPLAIPPLIAAVALGAVVVGRWVKREIDRVNEELDSLRTAKPAEAVDRSHLPTLRRDPETGEYRLS